MQKRETNVIIAGALLLVLAFSSAASAETTFSQRLKAGVRFFPKLLWATGKQLVSPRSLWVLGATAGATYTTYRFNGSIYNELRRENPHQNFTALGRNYGFALNTFAPQVGVTLAGLAAKNRQATRTGYTLLSATAVQRPIVAVLQWSTGDNRPDSHVGETTTGGTFPSGHATSAAMAAGVIQDQYGTAWALPVHTLALYTGWTRVVEGAHRPHEVVAGWGLGYAVGLAASAAMKELDGEMPDLMLVPTINPVASAYGVQIVQRF